MVDVECNKCGSRINVDDMAIIVVCPECGKVTRVCDNCHIIHPYMDCGECPYMAGVNVANKLKEINE